MGMFDWIEYEDTCECGQVLEGFQSKDADCSLDVLTSDKVTYFYAYCNNCKK